MTESREPTPAQADPQLDLEAQQNVNEQRPLLDFPVVGIGASAGGLQAFSEFLETVTVDSGMAFVLVQHLPPTVDSMLVELLAKRCRIPVLEVEDGMHIEPNHVYVIKPGNVLTVRDGILRLGQVLDGRAKRPVDDFFKSLAEEQRERAVCIVMSGMGSNGTAGAQAIKAIGGLCIAQDPRAAEFPSMPRSLIDSGNAERSACCRCCTSACAKAARYFSAAARPSAPMSCSPPSTRSCASSGAPAPRVTATSTSPSFRRCSRPSIASASPRCARRNGCRLAS